MLYCEFLLLTLSLFYYLEFLKKHEAYFEIMIWCLKILQ